MKGDVNPDQEIAEDEEEPDEKDHHVKHRRGLSRYIAPPAHLQQITSGITQQVTQVTHQVTNVTHRFTTKFMVREYTTPSIIFIHFILIVKSC